MIVFPVDQSLSPGGTLEPQRHYHEVTQTPLTSHVVRACQQAQHTVSCHVCLSERGYTNSKFSSEFIKWFTVQVTQRCGPLSARQSDQKKATTLLQNELLYCHTNMM